MSEAERAGTSRQDTRQDKSERLLAGRYRLGDVLGRGGMGTVWRAEDETLGRTVAVKELRFPSDIDEEEKRRLITRTLREAKAIARIRDTSAVTVFDVVDEDDRPWIVMELVEGKSLAEVIREDGLLKPRRAAEVGLAVLDVLRSAHQQGILHRDVKPSNVLIAEDGRVVLTDFGIAQVEGDPSITSTGMLVGAPSYISPERARGHKPGPAADMWSLGGLIYASVEGTPPYDKGSAIATLTAVMTEPLEEPKHAGPLRDVIYGLLEKDPEKRLDDAGARAMLSAIVNAPERGEAEPEPPLDATTVVPLPAQPDRRVGKAGRKGPGFRSGAAASGPAAAAGSGAGAAASTAGSASGSGTAAKSGSGPASGPGSAAGAGGRRGEEAADRLRGALRSVRKAASAAGAAGAAGAATSEAASRTESTAAATGSASPSSSVSSASGATTAGAKAAPSAGGSTVTGGKTGTAGDGRQAGRSGSGWPVVPPPDLDLPARPVPRAPLSDVVPRRTLLIIAVVVVLAVLGIVLTVALGGDDKDSADGRSGTGHSSASAGASAGGAAEKDKAGGSGSGGQRTDSAVGTAGSGSSPVASGGGEKGSGTGKSTGTGTGAGTGTSTGTGAGTGASGGEHPGSGSGGDAGTTPYKGEQGFSIGLPKGWKYASTDSAGVRFTGPGGQKLLIGWTSTPKDDPVADWQNQERYMVRSQYHRIRIEKVDYRGWKTADWEFTYVDDGTGFRTIDRGFVVNDHLGYALMYTAKADDWHSDLRGDTWRALTKSFEPK
jgi:tRNA A-37 threonylcarbamoyl transferase component Bud32